MWTEEDEDALSLLEREFDDDGTPTSSVHNKPHNRGAPPVCTKRVAQLRNEHREQQDLLRVDSGGDLQIKFLEVNQTPRKV